MAEEYTPTTEEVRERYAAGYMYGARGEFDRWLAERDAETRRKALEEAARNLPFPADPYGGFDHESLRAAQVQHGNWLRALAEGGENREV